MISPDETAERKSVSDLIQAERAVVAERRARERALELAVQLFRSTDHAFTVNADVQRVALAFSAFIDTGKVTHARQF